MLMVATSRCNDNNTLPDTADSRNKCQQQVDDSNQYLTAMIIISPMSSTDKKTSPLAMSSVMSQLNPVYKASS